MNTAIAATRDGVLSFSNSREDKPMSPASIAADNSLLVIDRELDSLLDRMHVKGGVKPDQRGGGKVGQ